MQGQVPRPIIDQLVNAHNVAKQREEEKKSNVQPVVVKPVVPKRPVTPTVVQNLAVKIN